MGTIDLDELIRGTPSNLDELIQELIRGTPRNLDELIRRAVVCVTPQDDRVKWRSVSREQQLDTLFCQVSGDYHSMNSFLIALCVFSFCV